MFSFIIQNKTALTEHGASGNRFSVQPEGDLRQNDSHDAREVGLNHKIANLSFQMEICCHHYIFAWVRGRKQRETHRGQRDGSWNIQGWRFKFNQLFIKKQKKNQPMADSGHWNKWSVGIGWSEYFTCLGTFQRDVTIDNFSLKKKKKLHFLLLWFCLSVMLPAVLWPLTVKIAP